MKTTQQQFIVGFLLMSLIGNGMAQLLKYTCSDAERSIAQSNLEACGTRLNTNPRLSVCTKLEALTEQCGNLMSDCLEPKDLRRAKDAMIDTFTSLLDSSNLSFLYEDCETVKEFRESGRSIYEATEFCTVEEVESVSNDNKECAEGERQNLLLEIRSDPPSSRADVSDRLCQFANKVFTDCVGLVKPCFSEEDYETMVSESLRVLADLFEKLKLDFDLRDECPNLNIPDSLKRR